MTNEELAYRVNQGDKNAVNELYIQNMSLIFKLARSYQNRHSKRLEACGIELDDMLNESYFVISEAAEAFCRNGSGHKFTSYLKFPLLNVFNALAGYRTKSKWKEPLNIAKSLDMPIDENEDMTLGDTLPDDAAAFEDALIDDIALSGVFPAVYEALKGDRRYTVIEQVYKYNKSQKDIGDMIGVSHQMVQQIKNAALRELRRPNHKKIQEYAKEYADIISQSIGRSSIGFFNSTGKSSVEWAVLEEEKLHRKRVKKWQEGFERLKEQYYEKR